MRVFLISLNSPRDSTKCNEPFYLLSCLSRVSNLFCLVVLGAVVNHPVLPDRPGWVGPVQLHLPGAQIREAQVCGSRAGESGVGGGPWTGSCSATGRKKERKIEIISGQV